jgi:hypothetical protein
MTLNSLPTDVGEEDKTSIIIMTCSRFKQTWEPFFRLFSKYWPDCPYKTYVVSDCESGFPDFDGIEKIKFTSDIGWCSMILQAVSTINSEYFIIFQDDFFIKEKVDTEAVGRLVKYAREENIAYLRLCPCPGPSAKWKDDFVGKIGLNDDYRVSLQLSIWKRDTIKGIIRPNETVWDIEDIGITRSKSIKEPFLSIWRESDNEPGGPVRYFITGVTRGEWTPGVIDFLNKEGISVKSGIIK